MNTALESRNPVLKPFDAPIQYPLPWEFPTDLNQDICFNEIKNTYACQTLNKRECNWILNFLTTGGRSLTRYDEYLKMEEEDTLNKVEDPKIIRRH